MGGCSVGWFVVVCFSYVSLFVCLYVSSFVFSSYFVEFLLLIGGQVGWLTGCCFYFICLFLFLCF